ncbi:MAG: outer membrane beta-barrel protein [Candidatus Aminicenantes bacterium]|nr:outer membrane beta-barrel protein [Candidatus Aminicenantes bacterium]
MKRKLAILTTIIFVLFTLTGISQAKDFSLKLTGGYGTMTVGDYNSLGGDFEALFDVLVAAGATKQGEFKSLKWGFEGEGEIIFKLPAGLGIGIGVGYIQRSNESDLGVSIPLVGEFSLNMQPDLTAIPINLSAYYFTPGAVPLKLFVYGGVGYYFGKINHIFRVDMSPPAYWNQNEGDIKDQGFGFHGGAGLEFSFVPKVSFFIEGRARYCKLKSWEGSETSLDSLGATYSHSGTLWYFEAQDTSFGTGQWFTALALSDTQPTGADIRNVRKYETDLSGFIVRVGIRIKF